MCVCVCVCVSVCSCHSATPVGVPALIIHDSVLLGVTKVGSKSLASSHTRHLFSTYPLSHRLTHPHTHAYNLTR